jgi:hypothetical protein
MAPRVFSGMLMVCMLVLSSVGCARDNASGSPSSTVAVDAGHPADSSLDVGEAREIPRGGEDYDYIGWALSPEGGRLGWGVRVDESWRFQSEKEQDELGNPESAMHWTWSAGEGQMELCRLNNTGSKSPGSRVAAALENIGEEGIAEYGEFKTQYADNANYLKTTSEGLVSISIFFELKPRWWETEEADSWVPPPKIFLLEYHGGDATDAFSEDAFWKAAQSMFFDADRHNQGEPAPYTPMPGRLTELSSRDSATISADQFVPPEYLDNVHVTFGELKSKYPDLKYVKSDPVSWDMNRMSFVASADDKVYYLDKGGQSFGGIPLEFVDDFSKFGDMIVCGLYGEVGTLIPAMQSEITINEFRDCIGASLNDYSFMDEAFDGYYGYLFPGFQLMVSTEPWRKTIRPDDRAELYFFTNDAELIAEQEAIEKRLWEEAVR